MARNSNPRRVRAKKKATAQATRTARKKATLAALPSSPREGSRRASGRAGVCSVWAT